MSRKDAASRIAKNAKRLERGSGRWAASLVCCAMLCAAQSGGQNKGSELQQAEEHVRQQPQSAEAQNALGEALDEAGELEAAREAFERAIQLKTDYGQAQLNLGLVSLQLKAPDQAAGQLDLAIKLLGNSPESGYASYLRAKVYNARNDTESALHALNRAVALRPDLAEAWSDLGAARKATLDDRGALAAYKKAVDLNPQDGVAQYRLGAEYLHQDQAGPAEQHLKLAYEHNPQDQSVLNALQSALRKEGKTAEAELVKAKLTKMLQDKDTATQNAVTAIKLNNEGAGLQKEGDLQGASDKYGQALKLYPEHVGIRVNYAVALLRLGHWTEGLDELHEASRRDPGNAQIRAALKDALAQAPPELVPKWKDDEPK